MGRFMRIVVVAAAVVAVAAATASGGVQQLTRIVNDVDPGESADLTSFCGFPVTVTYTGESRVTLVYDQSGLVVREIDSGTVLKTYTSANGSIRSMFLRRSSPTREVRRSARRRRDFRRPSGARAEFHPVQCGLVRVEGTVADFDGDIPVVGFGGERADTRRQK